MNSNALPHWASLGWLTAACAGALRMPASSPAQVARSIPETLEYEWRKIDTAQGAVGK